MKSIATAPGALPVVGHMIPLLRNPLEFLSSLVEFGSLVRIRIGPARPVVICDPGLLDQVLRDERTFDKGGPFFDRVREFLGNGLATCTHDQHRRQRRLLQPAFHPARFPEYARTMTAQTIEVTSGWRENQVIDVLADLMKITSGTLAATMFSGSLGLPVLRQAVDDVAIVAAGTYRRMLVPPPLDRLPTPGNHRYRGAVARLRHAMDRLIADRRATGVDHGDLLCAMLAARDPETHDHGLSDAEIVDNLMTFILAGAESTASTLAWAIHLLGAHPDVEERVGAEVAGVLAGAPAALEHLPKLGLTSRVLKEAMRLYPPGWIFTRVVSTDARLDGHFLPAGTSLVYSPYIIHRRGDLYRDPERFNPDRWDSATIPQPPRNAFIPFGAGPRKCIGDQFSVTEASLTLATIISCWQLKPIPGKPVRPGRAIALAPRGLRMRIESRDMSAGAFT